MEELAAHLPNLPHVVWILISTVVCILIGGAIGAVLQRLTGWRWAMAGALILANAIGYSSANLVADAQAKGREAKTLLTELEAAEPMKTILRLEPAVRAELERGVARALETGSSATKTAATRKVFNDIVQPRLSKAAPLAGAAETRRAIAAELAALRALEDRPALCVDVYAGRGLANLDILDPKIGREILASKAGVIESATLRPEKLEVPLSDEEMQALLVKAVAAQGMDISRLANLSKMETLPPKEACSLAILFETLLVALDPKDMAAFMKTAIAQSAAAQP